MRSDVLICTLKVYTKDEYRKKKNTQNLDLIPILITMNTLCIFLFMTLGLIHNKNFSS